MRFQKGFVNSSPSGLKPSSLNSRSKTHSQVLNIVSGKPVAAGEIGTNAYATSTVGPARGYAKAGQGLGASAALQNLSVVRRCYQARAWL